MRIYMCEYVAFAVSVHTIMVSKLIISMNPRAAK